VIDPEDEWGLDCPGTGFELPPRSPLIRLQPLGLGTPDRECLSSYFLRLADAHRLSPMMLAREILFPERIKEGVLRTNHFDCAWKRPFFNGIGVPCQVWVPRLKELTMVDGLERLTLGFLDRLSTRGLVSAKSRWCPACFREDQERGIPYGRLIWCIEAVTCCPKHGNKLVERCGCGPDEAQAPGMIKCLPHICNQCGRNLGLENGRGSDLPSEKDLRHSRMVADLLLSELPAPDQPSSRDIADFLNESLTTYANGNAMALGRLLGVGKSTLHGWLHRGHTPGFTEIMMIAEAHGCSISDVICGRSEAVTTSPMIPKSIRTAKKRQKKKPRKLNWDTIIKRLKEILEQDPPINVAEASRRVEVSYDLLKNKEPEICSAITARWMIWQRSLVVQRDEELAERVRLAARQMAESGIRPTWRRLQDEGLLAGSPWRSRVALRGMCKDIWLEFHPSGGI
jgi:hypothetical protein